MSMNAHASAQHNPLRVQVAEEVRATMARRRVSGVALARRLGKSQPWISRRLVGDVAFDLDDLEAIATALDVPVAQLLGNAVTDSYRQPLTDVTRRVDRPVISDKGDAKIIKHPTFDRLVRELSPAISIKSSVG
jgi:transcriptional regulator with XRE-family HTH domain